jgi:alkanesulfonate monooxygenase SsuD/methylene tetrahydromethanopterin reductase-like flavin-dependent oxidoreductase (luciferase family)
MKIVFTSGIRTLPGRAYPLSDLYRDHLEEAALAEELGFDCVWVSEHHFSPDAWNPSPFTFLAAVAARTARVRLGTYVLLLPLHNPVRVAEDVAVLDNISGGRVDLGVGIGSSPAEFRAFGIPVENRLGRTFEALRIIERCFAGEEFSHEGKYYTFHNVHLTTTPVQKPGPPILVAAMGDQSVAWTARRGYHMAAGAGRSRQIPRRAAPARTRPGNPPDRLRPDPRPCRRNPRAGLGRGRGRAAPGPVFLPHARQPGGRHAICRAARRAAAGRRIPRCAGHRAWRRAIRGRHAGSGPGVADAVP